MANDVLLTIGVAALSGVVAQAIARRIGIPAILALLGTGALLGSSGLGIVNPAGLGRGLGVFVELAVAVILFEGALTLRPSEVRRHAGTIGYLLTLGALVTFVGATAVVRYALGFNWSHSVLVGSILIVTGPTVVIPLLRFVRPKPALAEMLRWEAILIDPIGVLVAVVVLEAVLVGGGQVLVVAATSYAKTLVAGTAIGVLFAMLLGWLLSAKSFVDDDLRSPAGLATAFASFAIAESLVPNSGLFAVTAGGLTLAIRRPPGLDDIEHFKGRLTSFMLGILFVLLAGLIDLTTVAKVGKNGVYLLGGLLGVRFVGVTLSTIGSGLGFRERFFLAWMSPRGVVAAASSSVFAQKLAEHGDPQADEVRTAVFCVIVGTVLFQGLTARWLARALGILAPEPNEVVIVGAGPFGRGLAVALADAGSLVTVIDKNPAKVAVLAHARIKTLAADAHSRAAVSSIDPPSVAFVIANTPNDEANALVCRAFAGAGVARVTQLPTGASAAATGEENAATEYEFSFGGRITLELVERELAGGARIEALRLDAAERIEQLEARLNEGFHALIEVKAGGAPRLIRTGEESLGPGTLVLGLASTPIVRAPEAPVVVLAAPPRRSVAAEVGLAVGASVLAVVPALPLLRAPLELAERARPLAANAYRPLAALLQDLEVAKLGTEAPHLYRAVALVAYALLVAASYAFARRSGLGRHAAFTAAALFGVAAGHLSVLASVPDHGEVLGGALLVAALATHSSASIVASLVASVLLGGSLLFTNAGVLFVPLVLVLDALRAERPSLRRAILASLPSFLATGAYLYFRHRALGDEHLAALLPGNLAGVSADFRLYAMARGLLDALGRTVTLSPLGLGGPEAALALMAVSLGVAALGSATRRSRELGGAAAVLAFTFLPSWNPLTVDASAAHVLLPSLGMALVATVLIDAIGSRSASVRTATAAALVAASGITTALVALDRCG